MLKILGLFCLLIGSSLAGMMTANSLEKVPKDVAKLRSGLESLAAQIEFKRLPLVDIMNALGGELGGDVGRLFSLWSKNIAQYCRPPLALSKAREVVGPALNFPLPLWAILEDLARSLGSSPTADQINVIALAQIRLAGLEEVLIKEVPKKAKLWRYIGVLGGIALAIVCL